MKEFDYSIFKAYFSKQIKREEFLKKLIHIYNSDKYFLLHELSNSYIEKNPDNINKLIYMLYVLEQEIEGFNLSAYLDILNKLIISDWHCEHEDIVLLLVKISDTSSLEYISKAMNLKLDYLEWDDNYAFEKKCVHAIARIGDKKAIPYLKTISTEKNLIVRDCAIKQITKISDNHKSEENEIRAVFNDKTIRVYQAYNKSIATEAIHLGTFGDSFKMNRMTWIKPSFLWMMYRCGWASKSNQECVLAIDIKREGFDYIVKNAVTSSYQEEYGSQNYWKFKLNKSDVICQWDPERDIYGNPLDYRSIQLGLRGKALDNYVHNWIVSIQDITDYVTELKQMINANEDISHLLPKELKYPILYM